MSRTLCGLVFYPSWYLDWDIWFPVKGVDHIENFYIGDHQGRDYTSLGYNGCGG